jgi:protein phosphatase
MVSDEEIARLILSGPGSLEEMSQSLVDAANEAGGRDNVTAVLLRYSEGS